MHPAIAGTSFNTFWKAQIAQDSAGTLYLTWTTDDRKAGTSGGCSGAQTPTANSVLLTPFDRRRQALVEADRRCAPGHDRQLAMDRRRVSRSGRGRVVRL